MTISFQIPDQVGLIEDFLSISMLDYANVADDGWDDECQQALGIDDPNTRSKELFIKKCSFTSP